MPGYDISPKIGLDGEKEFRTSLTNVNASLKTLGTELKAVSSEFVDETNKADNLKRQNEVLTKSIDAQREKVALLKDQLEKAAEKYGENDKYVERLKQQLNLATAELNKNEAQVKNNDKALDEMATSTEKAGNTADEQKSKFSGLGEACKKAGEAMAVAFAAMATAAVGAVKALADMTTNAAAFADSVLTESSVTGIATDKLQEYMYAAELVDVSTETLTKSMAKNIKSMSSAQSGTKAMTEAYAKLGVSVTDSNGNLRDGEEVYWEVIDALGKVTNETERDAIGMQLLGKSAQELNPLIEAGAETMQALGERAQEAGYVMSGDTLNAFGEFDNQIQLLKVDGEAAKNALGEVLLPVLTSLATDGVSLLEQFSSGVQDADGDLGKIGEVIADLLPQATEALLKYAPQFAEMLGTIFSSLATDVAPQLIQCALDIVSQLSTSLIENLPIIIQAALQLIIELARGIAEAIPELLPTIVNVVIEIAHMLSDPQTLKELLNACFDIIDAIGNGLMDAIPELVNAAVEIIMQLTLFLTDPENIGRLIETALKLVLAIAGGIMAAIPSFLTAIAQFPNKIKDYFADRDWDTIGGNIVDGIKNGLKNAWHKVTEWFDNAVDSLVDGVKDLLGIASPSKVFAKIGGYMAEGLGVGWEKEIGDVNKGIASSLDYTGITAPVSAEATLGSSILGGLEAITGANGGSIVLNLTSEIDGTVLARNQYKLNLAEAARRGTALVV